MTIRTRFAPSPTGYLHIGGVRTALFNWLLAKQGNGQFLLRIDDTDANRNVAEALQPILDGFRWLNLNWDEGPTPDGMESVGPHGPYFQSQRSALYVEAAQKLLDQGFAYRDYAKPEELQALREAAEKSGSAFVYDRRWMADSEAKAQQFAAEGRTAVVRLKMPREGSCRFHDKVRGDVEFQWSEEQDHVIQRADGTCLYHLASVVDDHAMQITHVVRAVEHLSNTPRQIFIAQSLGFELPEYAHLPFVAEPGGTSKLSKRKLDKYLKNKDFAALFEHGTRIAERKGRMDRAAKLNPETFNPVIVDFYREIGFLPDAILNYLLLLGWSLDDSTEDFTREQMLEHFSLARVNKAPASFDPQKLSAFQSRWMNKLSAEEKLAECRPFLSAAGLLGNARPQPDENAPLDYQRIPDQGAPDQRAPDQAIFDPRIRSVILAADDRIKIAGDILDFDGFFVPDGELNYDEMAFEKRLRNDAKASRLLQQFRHDLADLESFDAATTEACLKSFVEKQGVKFNEIIHALRVAITGKAVGFGMFDALAILGQQSCLARIDRALALVGVSA